MEVIKRFEGYFNLIVCVTRLYNNSISKFKNIGGWSKYINCNIDVNQGFPLFPSSFGIYIDNSKGCLIEVGHTSMTLAGISIILLLYVDDNG